MDEPFFPNLINEAFIDMHRLECMHLVQMHALRVAAFTIVLYINQRTTEHTTRTLRKQFVNAQRDPTRF